jgi:uncharacterized membrane protein
MKKPLRHCLKYKSCYKTISWRFVASSITFVINFSIFGSFGAAGIATVLDQTAKTVLYYANEKLWLKCNSYNDDDDDDIISVNDNNINVEIP